jgi:AGZA family xanthine/uracil permease-like MFS transporter
MVVVLSWFGVISLMLAVIPVVAISPILLYIGMLICAQAFQTTPREHAPAIALALTPHLAAWASTLLGGALGAAGMNFGATHAPEFVGKMAQNGVLFHGLEVMGGGSILTGLVLGAIAVFVIERKFLNASAFALAAAVLTYFGFMHGDAIGIGHGFGVTPAVAFAYLVVSAFLFTLSKSPVLAPAPSPKAVPAE